MEWQVIDEVTGQLRRKWSNETMRQLKEYIDTNNLKDTNKGYNEILDGLDIGLNVALEFRTADELAEDRVVRSIE